MSRLTPLSTATCTGAVYCGRSNRATGRLYPTVGAPRLVGGAPADRDARREAELPYAGLADLLASVEDAALGELLVVVDDVQWLERLTAAALTFALRRLGGVPV